MADLYRVRVLLSGSDVEGGGVATHYFNSTGGSVAQAVTAVSTFWGSLAAYMSSLVRWDLDTEIRTIDAEDGAVLNVSFVSAAGASGSDTSGSDSPLLQGLIQWRTNGVVNSHNVRGRTFVPGVPKGFVTSTGGVHSTYQTALDTAGEALRTDANSELVVWARPAPYAAPARIGGPHIVTAVTVWNKFAVLRSRRD